MLGILASGPTWGIKINFKKINYYNGLIWDSTNLFLFNWRDQEWHASTILFLWIYSLIMKVFLNYCQFWRILFTMVSKFWILKLHNMPKYNFEQIKLIIWHTSAECVTIILNRNPKFVSNSTNWKKLPKLIIRCFIMFNRICGLVIEHFMY